MMIITSHAVDLHLNEPITYIQQYQICAHKMQLDPKQLMTVKPFPFIRDLDPSQSPLSVSFLPDPVQEGLFGDK